MQSKQRAWGEYQSFLDYSTAATTSYQAAVNTAYANLLAAKQVPAGVAPRHHPPVCCVAPLPTARAPAPPPPVRPAQGLRETQYSASAVLTGSPWAQLQAARVTAAQAQAAYDSIQVSSSSGDPAAVSRAGARP